MLKTLRNAWKVEDIRRKMLFTLFMLLLYRLGNAVPVPWVNTTTLQTYFQMYSNTVLGIYNVMSGSSFSQATIFALSIQPYINASIIIQLLCIAIPALERLSKEGGEEGKKKINDITRYTTVGLAILQGYGYYALLSANNATYGLLAQDGVWQAISIVATFCAGSALLMWMGEQITEFGLSNGISVILFISIVSRFPRSIINSVASIIAEPKTWWIYLLLLAGSLLIIALIVAFFAHRIRVSARRSATRRRESALVSGKVMQIIGETHLDLDGDPVTEYLARVEYAVDDIPYEARADIDLKTIRKYGKDAFVGRAVPVYYNPADPAEAFVNKLDKRMLPKQRRKILRLLKERFFPARTAA